MNIHNIIIFLIGLPKTIYFNFRYLPFKHAIKLPILVSNTVILMKCCGEIKIQSPICFGMIRIGYGDIAIFDKTKSRSIWNVSGIVIFKGKTHIGHGSKISVSGVLTVGSNFTISAESVIDCHKNITFGDNVLISWENLFMDADLHKIIINNDISNYPKEITIGDHVWFGCRCTILKGTKVCNDIVIAAGSLLTGVFSKQNTVIGGNPAKIIKENVQWTK